MFEGCIVALVTPFRDGEVDYDNLKELVDFHVAEGADGLAPVGTTGESPTLSHETHRRVIAKVVEFAGGRIKVIVGTGSNSTQEAIELTRHAKASGADGALVVGPYYNKPTQEGHYRHYMALAEVGLPIVVYNIPGRTGVNMAPATIARMAAHEHIVAVKEATGSMDQASEILSLCDITILSGDDSLTLPLMALGGKGVISVVANIIPTDVKAMIAAFNDGRMAEATAAHGKLFPLCKAMFIETNPIPVKTAMKLLGRGSGELLLPMCEMSDANVEKLAAAMQAYGLDV
jgi:4-hydroxy-tetrahydrodipicolinate synthase